MLAHAVSCKTKIRSSPGIVAATPTVVLDSWTSMRPFYQVRGRGERGVSAEQITARYSMMARGAMIETSSWKGRKLHRERRNVAHVSAGASARRNVYIYILCCTIRSIWQRSGPRPHGKWHGQSPRQLFFFDSLVARTQTTLHFVSTFVVQCRREDGQVTYRGVVRIERFVQ